MFMMHFNNIDLVERDVIPFEQYYGFMLENQLKH